MRALERMDAMLSETKPDGRPIAFDKVAGVVVTGNEDGAHHIVGTVSQALIDIGFTVPGQAWTYWHLGPGPGPDYLEELQGPRLVRPDRPQRRAIMALVAGALAAHPMPQIETSDD